MNKCFCSWLMHILKPKSSTTPSITPSGMEENDPNAPKIDARNGEELGMVPEGVYEAYVIKVGKPTPSKIVPERGYIRLELRIVGGGKTIFTLVSGYPPAIMLIHSLERELLGKIYKIRVKHEVFHGRRMYSTASIVHGDLQ